MLRKRYEKNPILIPNKNQDWEAEAVFNPCPVEKEGKIFLLYRAFSSPSYHPEVDRIFRMSRIAIAESEDGINFYNRRLFIIPEKEWEIFGCEDPRVTKLNKKFYIFYTALSSMPPHAETIKVGLAISEDLKTIREKHLVTPFNAKAMSLFSEKIHGKIWGILTVHTDKPPAKICLVAFEEEEQIWSEDFWKKWYRDFESFSLLLPQTPQDHIESGPPPLKTEDGWLLFYCYIKDYFSPHRIFELRVVLLDLEDPFKIIEKFPHPLLVPEKYYEKYGMVPQVIFPSGALLKKNQIFLYYGAADTTCALAFIDLPTLKDRLLRRKTALKLQRPKELPIITPIKDEPWQAKATFNPAAIYLGGKVHIIYRAMSEDNTSVLGYATSSDGINIDYRSPQPIYVPREPFEQKLIPFANSGCEDPRIVKIEDKIYMCYTAFDGKNPPRVALTWIKEEDFLSQRWIWAKPKAISPHWIWDKDASLFPKKIKGEYIIIHRIGESIDLSFHKDLEFEETKWLEEYNWILPRKDWWDSVKVGLAGPPIETPKGWLVFYHGIDENATYRVGAVLADLENPTIILARTDYPILEPQTSYEKEGIVANVVFPCGAVVIKDTIFVYYGCADKVVGVATIKLAQLLDLLKP